MRSIFLSFLLAAAATTPIHGQQPKAITNSIGMKLVLIHPGSFTMGSPNDEKGHEDNEAPHEVTISNSYYLGIHEVTQAQYEKVTGTNPSYFKGSTMPVENLSWDSAATFCKRLSEMPVEKAAGREYRLPTEAEWEYACRATSTTAFCSGNEEDTLEDFAWFGEEPTSESHAVGLKKANRWGLYDMHGNVCEWCQDRYDAPPKDADPRRKEPTRGWSHAIRGGCVNFESTNCRSAMRLITTDGKAGNVGFRVAMRLATKASEPEASPHYSKHLCKVNSVENLWEGEAPAEPTVQWFGRSLTLPSNELLR